MSGIAFENHEEYCCIEFSRDLASMTWEQTEKVTQKIIELIGASKHNTVIVSANGFSSLPDGVLGALLRVWKSLDERSRNLVLVTDSQSLINEIDNSGMLKFWRVMPSMEIALKSLRLSAPSVASGVPAASRTSVGETSGGVSGSEPFRFEENKRYCLLHFSSVLDKLSWSDQEAVSNAAILQYEAAKAVNLMVDLSEIRYVNSGGIAGLVRIWKATQKKEGQFAVVSPNAEVTTALKASGLAKVWSITEDREEAAYGMGVSHAARVERREKNLLIAVCVPCAVIAGLALIPMFLKRESVLGVNSQLTALLLGSAAAATGLIGVLRESGWRRKISAAAVAVSLLVLSTLWFRENPINFRRRLADFPLGRELLAPESGENTTDESGSGESLLKVD